MTIAALQTANRMMASRGLGAAMAVLLLTLSACDKIQENHVISANASSAAAGPRPAATPIEAGGEASTSARPNAESPPRTRDCLLEVDKVRHVDGPCLVYPMGEGYTLNAWSHGKPDRSHFAVVVPDGDGEADATWNADPDDSRAWDSLGAVRKEGDCWINDRARICAR